MFVLGTELRGWTVQLPLFCGFDLLLHDFSHAVPVCDRVPLRTGGPTSHGPWHVVVAGINLRFLDLSPQVLDLNSGLTV